MNNDIKILQAMLLMSATLSYSSTYKESLIKELTLLIQKASR